jgi:rod shape determining protein RodA
VKRIRFNFIIPLLLLPFIIISLFLVHEISNKLFIKELIYISIGIGVFTFIYFVPIRKILWIVPFFYWLNIILLLLVDLVGIRILGAQRWLKIPIINLTIQPSEFMKTTLLLMLAYLIHKYPPRPVYTFKEFLRLSIYIVIPFVLIAKEPDLGTALITLIVGFGILFLVGVDKKVWIGIFVSLIVIVPVYYQYFMKDYQKQRIENFLNKPSYHVKQSIIAIGSGGLTGKPKDEATQTQLKFLPIASSDFIFAYLVERFGFLGAVGLILSYFILILYLLFISFKAKDDYLTKVMFGGVALMIFIYSYINISMTMNLAPVVGVPLPLVSHGGTSFINFMLLFGILERLISKKDFLHIHGVK